MQTSSFRNKEIPLIHRKKNLNSTICCFPPFCKYKTYKLKELPTLKSSEYTVQWLQFSHATFRTIVCRLTTITCCKKSFLLKEQKQKFLLLKGIIGHGRRKRYLQRTRSNRPEHDARGEKLTATIKTSCVTLEVLRNQMSQERRRDEWLLLAEDFAFLWHRQQRNQKDEKMKEKKEHMKTEIWLKE